MKHYTVYEEASGVILKTLMQVKPPRLAAGEAFIVGNYPDDQFDIIDGAPVLNVKQYESAEIVDDPVEQDELPADQQARIQRDMALAATDWTQLADAPVDRAAWAAYRQELRDITNQAGFPDDIVWPDQPNSNNE